MVKKVSMFAVLMIAATSLMAFDEPIRRTVIVRDGNVVFDDDGGLLGKRAYLGVSRVLRCVERSRRARLFRRGERTGR